MLTPVLLFFGVCRVVLGLAPFFTPTLGARLLGVPRGHDNPTGRLMARLFGVRDVGLGVLVFWALAHPALLPFALGFNALTDFGDVAAAAIPLVKREGIDRVAWTTIAMAGTAGTSWAITFALVA